jgi:uncharacterized protein (DUF2126 family)
MSSKIQTQNLTRKGMGRPKGSPNRVAKEAKDIIAAAAEKLGGIERMVKWAKEDPLNERAFWSTIYPKLIPVQLTGKDGGPIKTTTRVMLVAYDPNNDDAED